MEKEVKQENRLTKMEQKIDNLTEGVEKVFQSVDKIDAKLDKHIDWETDKYEKMDEKYSGKWVERLVLSITGGLAVAILAALVLYFKK